MRLSIAVFLVILTLTATAGARTWYVNPGGTGDAPSIQAAIDSSSHGDIVELADGTYTGTGNRDLDYTGKRIIIRSQSGDPSLCIINCQGTMVDPHRAFYFSYGEDSLSVLRDITITEGNHPYGGALNIEESSPLIDGCVFIGNQATEGGGIWTYNSGSIIRNCWFEDNWAGGQGAGICFSDESPVVEGCTFVDNMTNGDGAGICLDITFGVTISHCTFYENEAWGIGSGIACIQSSPSISYTIISFGVSGGAVGCGTGASPTLTCSDLYGNAGGDWVGCIAGQLGVSGNISANPRFCNPGAGDFTLHTTSPCKSGGGGCGLQGAWPMGCAMRTLVVNASGTGDFPTIQAAVDVAWTLDTVELLDGTYTGNGNRDIDFNGKAIEVRSQSGNPEACIIDCQADFYDKHRGFYLHSGEAALSKITGLTIKNGYTTDAGGAILCHGASPAISNCIIDSCISYLDGGGISYWSAPGRPSLDSCVFKNNHTYGEWGGGVCCLSSDVDISDCIFMGNTIDFPAEGGGLGLVESESHVMRCTFYANETDPADPRGSAIYWYDCTPIIENTIMAFGIGGPPMYSHGDSVATLICCDLYGNEGGDWTGSIASQYGTNGNIWEDPRFCNPVAGNLTLHLSSPCAAPNNPGCGQIGALGIGCGPETYVVNSVGTGDFPTIQAAVDVAWDGDVVELVDGTYTGDGNRDIYMKNKAITLRSQSGNASSCVIDAEGSSGDNHQVMVISGPSHAPTYIEDITITGGWTSGYGGGVLCFGGRLSFSGCVFSNDSTFATEGGGLYMDSGTLTVTECLFNANSAGVGDGGAIYSGSGTTIVNSEFSSNVASNGSAIRASGSGLEIRGCDFHDHTSSTGGVVYLPVTSGEVTGCTFYQNSTDYGALQIYEGMPLISECTFTGNSGGAYGCAVLAWETEAEISQCTLAKNNCTSGSLIYSTGSKQPTISSCIMAFNTGAVPVSCADSFPSLACCDIYENELGDWVGCIAGQFGNNGNIRMDPLFCNPDSGDFTLYLESPCMADSAPPGCPRLGAHDVGCSSGAGVERPEPDLQDQLTLSQAVPNPFSGTTEIRYLIPSGHEASNVTLGVYDPTGRKVRTLVNSNQAPGAYRIAWDATNQGGGRAASGVYFLRISWNGQSQTRRVVLLR